MQRRVLLAFMTTLLAATCSLTAQAQVARRFTANTLRGDFVMLAFPNIQLNGQPARMAPGSRIFGDTNLLQQPGSLVGPHYLVNYRLEESSGLVMDVWILNPAEAANKFWPRNPQEAAKLKFDWETQTWSKP